MIRCQSEVRLPLRFDKAMKSCGKKKLTTQNIGARTIEFDFEINDLVEQLSDQLSSNFKQNAIPLALEASIAPLAEESEPSNNSRKMYPQCDNTGLQNLVVRRAFQMGKLDSFETLSSGMNSGRSQR